MLILIVKTNINKLVIEKDTIYEMSNAMLFVIVAWKESVKNGHIIFVLFIKLLNFFLEYFFFVLL